MPEEYCKYPKTAEGGQIMNKIFSILAVICIILVPPVMAKDNTTLMNDETAAEIVNPIGTDPTASNWETGVIANQNRSDFLNDTWDSPDGENRTVEYELETFPATVYYSSAITNASGIINGGFENGMQGWTTSRWRIGNGECKHSGTTSAELYYSSYMSNHISQTFTTDVPGAIRFWWSRHSLTTGPIIVKLDGIEVWRKDGQGTGSPEWFEGSVYCPTAGTHTISFTV